MAGKKNKSGMKKKITQDKNVVDEIKTRSKTRLQRIVIDEVLPGGAYRVLSAEMKPSAKESKVIDSTAWGEEVEHYLDWKQLSNLLSVKQPGEVGEGQVFRIKQKRAKSINDEVKKEVKAKTKNLLAREGMTQDEMKGRRR
ncbi:MAG: hypothetical protein FP824_02400 [Euryarchaeota archaeon]|nr:hypothetical protein [Euryarchaeota archaeon]